MRDFWRIIGGPERPRRGQVLDVWPRVLLRRKHHEDIDYADRPVPCRIVEVGAPQSYQPKGWSGWWVRLRPLAPVTLGGQRVSLAQVVVDCER